MFVPDQRHPLVPLTPVKPPIYSGYKKGKVYGQWQHAPFAITVFGRRSFSTWMPGLTSRALIAMQGWK
jgi:hypothetical protein